MPPDKTTLKESVYDDVVSVVSEYVGSPHSHVIRESDDEPDEPPMVALNVSTSPNERGMHNTEVLDEQTNPYDVKYGVPKEASFDITVTDVDGDRADNICDDLATNFDAYGGRIRDEQALVGDTDPPIEEVSSDSTNPVGRDDRIGASMVVQVEYLDTHWYSDVEEPPPLATNVEIDIE